MAAVNDVPGLSPALDYAWKRYTYRHTNAVQIVNFSLVAAAILSAGYVNAVTNDRFNVAAALSFAGAIIASVALAGYRAQVSEAAAASVCLRALEERMSELIELRSFAETTSRGGSTSGRGAVIVIMTSSYARASTAGVLGGIFALLK